MHRDLEPWNVARVSGGEFCLIDFSHSSVRHTCEEILARNYGGPFYFTADIRIRMKRTNVVSIEPHEPHFTGVLMMWDMLELPQTPDPNARVLVRVRPTPIDSTCRRPPSLKSSPCRRLVHYCMGFLENFRLTPLPSIACTLLESIFPVVICARVIDYLSVRMSTQRWRNR